MAEIFSLEYPQSLGVYDKYADAQKAVDFLSDNDFPVQNVLIVGTELRQVERGDRTPDVGPGHLRRRGLRRVAGPADRRDPQHLLRGQLGARHDPRRHRVRCRLRHRLRCFGRPATRGQRDFSSVQKVVATKYEVLVEHKFLADGTALLATMPGTAASNPFA